MQPGWSHEGAAYARGLLNGRNQGRIATLRLVYIGAACAEVVHDAIAFSIHNRRNTYEPELRDMHFRIADNAAEMALATLNTLASLGDETAIGLLAGRS